MVQNRAAQIETAVVKQNYLSSQCKKQAAKYDSSNLQQNAYPLPIIVTYLDTCPLCIHYKLIYLYNSVLPDFSWYKSQGRDVSSITASKYIAHISIYN